MMMSDTIAPYLMIFDHAVSPSYLAIGDTSPYCEETSILLCRSAYTDILRWGASQWHAKTNEEQKQWQSTPCVTGIYFNKGSGIDRTTLLLVRCTPVLGVHRLYSNCQCIESDQKPLTGKMLCIWRAHHLVYKIETFTWEQRYCQSGKTENKIATMYIEGQLQCARS
jgi:hypothetical protein